MEVPVEQVWAKVGQQAVELDVMRTQLEELRHEALTLWADLAEAQEQLQEMIGEQSDGPAVQEA